MKRMFPLMLSLMGVFALARGVYAADNGTEFYLEDDFTVRGTEGTALDPDTEIKGFTVFGSTQAVYAGAVIGPGNVVVNGVLSVSSGAYFVGNSTFTGADKVFINDGSAGQLLRKDASGSLIWVSPSLLGDGLGNHVATTTLQMGAYAINSSSNITAAYYQINGSTVLAVLPGVESIAVGSGAGRVNTGNYNSFAGVSAGRSNTTGFNNSFFGNYAGFNNISAANNTYVGYYSGRYATGGDNSYLGAYTGGANAGAGAQNTFLGSYAGYNSTSGGGNLYAGYMAAYYTRTGSANAIFGNRAGYGVTGNSFSSSTLIGYQAGYSLLDGSADNIFVGFQAGYNVAAGAGNIVIGYNEYTSAPDANDELNIGGVLYGDLAAKTIGISTRAPQAALDIVAPGTYAQIWRDSGGTIVSSVSAAGVMMAAKFIGDASGLTNVTSTSAVQKTGDTMTGQLTLAGSTLTVTGNAFSVGGSALSLTAGGQLGLGTFNPSEALDLAGRVQLSTAAMGNPSTDGLFSNGPNGMMFNSNGNTYMRVAFGGNYIGIGPSVTTGGGQARLQVQGNLSVGSVFTGYDTPVNGMIVEGRVGIGTGTPTALLEVRDLNASYGNVLEVGAGAATTLVVTTGGVVGVGTLYPSTQTVFHAHATASDKTGGEDVASGLLASVSVSGTGPEDAAVAGDFEAHIEGVENIGHLVGLHAQLSRDEATGGTVTNAIYMFLDALDNSAAGAVTNTYGIFISTLTAGAQTNAPYAIYSVDPNAGIYTAGRTGLGVSSAAARLDVLAHSALPASAVQLWRRYDGVAVATVTALGVFQGDGSGLQNVTAAGAVQKTGDTMTGGLNMSGSSVTITADTATQQYAFVTNGIVISTGGALTTIGAGNGTIGGNARGRGAVDLQTKRTAATQVASGVYSVISGGINHTAGNYYSTVGGGDTNTASGQSAVVSGGYNNTASGNYAIVGGGQSNTAANWNAVAAGGVSNTAGGQYSAVPGGNLNAAGGDYSFAAGRRAKANHLGSFVWADSQDADNASAAVDEFRVRAQGGFYVNSSSAVFTGRTGIGNMYPIAKLDVIESNNNAPYVLRIGTAADSYHLVVTTGGRVGLGTDKPFGNLHLSGTDSESALILEQVSPDKQIFYLAVLKARGTKGSPAIVQQDDDLGILAFVGYDGTPGDPYRESASIRGSVDGVPSIGNDMPGRLEFLTSPDGSASPLARMVIKNDGNVGISTGTPQARLDVAAAGSTVNDYAQIWRKSDGAVVASMTATGVLYASVAGDNLGDHTATKLISADFGVKSSSAIDAGYYQINGSTVFAILPGASLGIGVDAGRKSTGNSNTFVGNTAGGSNDAIGSDNVFVGYGAGNQNIWGGNNTFVGSFAGPNNSAGNNNSILGNRAYWSAANGYANSMFGAEAGYGGGGSFSSSTLMGYQAGYGLTTGSGNTFLGFRAGSGVTIGSGNIIIGYEEDATAPTISNELNIGGLIWGRLQQGYVGIGFVNTLPQAPLDVRSTGTGAGYYAQIWRDGTGAIVSSMTANGVLYAAVTGDNLGDHAATKLITADFGIKSSTAINAGYYQINGNTMAAILPGANSIAYGVYAGTSNIAGGDDNVFIGNYAGASNTTGWNNTASGSSALKLNTIGSNNTANGDAALYSNTTGWNNTVNGSFALYFNTTGQNNTANGASALYSGITGSANAVLGAEAGYGGAGGSFSSATLMGYQAGYGLTTGSGNILLGFRAGYAITTGTGNVIIGYDQGTSAPAANNELNIGGVLYGDLAGRTIGIATPFPQAALDIVSTGTAADVYAQIWRNSGGVIIASVSSTGIISASTFNAVGSAYLMNGVVVIDSYRNIYAKTLAVEQPMSVSTFTITGSEFSVGGSTLVVKAGSVGIGVINPQGLLQVGADGIVISSGGAIQTTGVGYGGTAGGARGLGAVDLQTTRAFISQVASGANSVISGGIQNSAGGNQSVVSGGWGNSASGSQGSITGGVNNKAGGQYSFVGGGMDNHASGFASAVGGGEANTANGQFSFAAGFKSSSTVNGSFTWTDSQGIQLDNTAVDRVVFKNRGGFLITGSTNTVMQGTVDRGVFVTGSGLVGIATGAPGAALDVVSTGAAITDYAQIWRKSDGAVVASMTATGVLYAAVQGDNLGNHTAAAPLDMAGFQLNNVSTINVQGENVVISPYSPGGNYAYAISIGSGAYNNYTDGVGVGRAAGNNYNSGVGLGRNAFGNYTYGVGVGYDAYSNYNNGVGVGYVANNNFTYGVGVGAYSQNNFYYGTGVGAYTTSRSSSVALGYYAKAFNVEAVALGAGARANANRSVCIGAYCVNNDTDTVKIREGSSLIVPADISVGTTTLPAAAGAVLYVSGGNIVLDKGKQLRLASGDPYTWLKRSVTDPPLIQIGGSGPGNARFEVLDSFAMSPKLVVDLNTGSVGISTGVPQGLFDVGGGSFVVKADGNVGIGTVNPGAKLDVVSTGTAADIYAQIWRNSSGVIIASVSSTGMMSASTFNAVGSAYMMNGAVVIDSDRNIYAKTLDVEQPMSVTTFTITGSEFTVGGSTLVVKAGNVGIGTAEPTAKFEVSGGSVVLHGLDSQPNVFQAGDNGIIISTGGAIQTTGMGYGIIAGTVRGPGAVDLQTKRSSSGQVASGQHSVVGGGGYNTASGFYSGVAAGNSNTASNGEAFVGGGTNNTADGYRSSISGGDSNNTGLAADYAAVAGGRSNSISAPQSLIGGGAYNIVSGSNSVISGGVYNVVEGTSAVVAGGENNRASGLRAVVGGGNLNESSGSYSSVPGGYHNAASSYTAVVGGGSNNAAKGDYSSIGGGNYNAADSIGAVVGGGQNNIAGGSYNSTVAGGSMNKAAADRASVGGGENNTAAGQNSTIAGGSNNTASGMYSAIPGGYQNSAGGQYSFAAGFKSTSAANGTFTWKDSQTDSVINDIANQVRFKASGGFWVSTSAVYSDPGLFISTNNRVGIGTTNPAQELVVIGSASVSGNMIVNGDLRARVWQRIYREDVGTAKVQINILNLNSSVDKEYKLVLRHVLNPVGACMNKQLTLAVNNATAGTYDYIDHISTTNAGGAGQSVAYGGAMSSLPIGYTGQNAGDQTFVEGTLSMSDMAAYKQFYIGKSYLLTSIPTRRMEEIAGTVVTAGGLATQLDIAVAGSSDACFDIGTSIELWAFR